MSLGQIGTLYVLVARPPQIVTMRCDGSERKLLLPDAGGTPDGIAVDGDGGYLYWTNMGKDFSQNDGYIQRMRLDGTGLETLVKAGGTFTPKQLVLDLPNKRMYWSDREGMRVMRAGMDGSNITVLVQTGQSDEERKDETLHCVGIAIDRQEQKIYWTQKGPSNGGKGRIFRAGLELPENESPMSRSDVELILEGLPEPIDLDLDTTTRFLYWTDRGDPPQGNSLNRVKVNVDGFGPHEVLSGGLQEGIGLALAEDLNAIFTSDLGGSLRRFNGPDFTSATVVLAMNQPLTGIAYTKK